MRKFFRYLTAFVFQVTFFSLLVLITFRFQILSSEFIITSFRDADVYNQSEELINTLVRERVRQDLETGDLAILPPEQKVVLENEIMKLVGVISADKIQDLLETNIKRFMSYINGDTEELLLYFPIQTWNLPEIITSQQAFGLLTENTRLGTLLGVEEAERVQRQLVEAKFNVDLVKKAWFTPIILLVLFLVIHFLLSTVPNRLKPTAWLLVISGLYTLVLCGIMFFASQEIAKRLAISGEPSFVIIRSIIPPLILGIINLWVKIAVGMTISGSLFLITYFIVKKVGNKK